VFSVAAYSIQCSTWSYLTLEADFYFADFSTVVPYDKIHQVKDSPGSINENNNKHPKICV
jgi:hypothetical protein